MAKRKKNHSAKRSLASLPKGLPVRGNAALAAMSGVNPFESLSRHNKRPKHATTAAAGPAAFSASGNKLKAAAAAAAAANKGPSSSSLVSQAMEHRQKTLRLQLQATKKKNAFVDRRIGEYNAEMTPEEQNLARLVRERTRRSKRSNKYSLDDDDNDHDDTHDHAPGHGRRGGGGLQLTHGGKSIDSLTAEERAKFLPNDDDDDEEGGQLDAVDTLRHFGGGPDGHAGADAEDAAYGPSGGDGSNNMKTLAQMYTSRKMELDDYVLRRKVLKQERLQSKEAQVDAFEEMDAFYASDLAPLLAFRDHRQQPGGHGLTTTNKPRVVSLSKNSGNDNDDDEDEDDAMGDWDKQLKEFQFMQRRKVAATDRTKTPEEIARERAERLHELETRRLARMNGDFNDNDEDDLLSDASEDIDGKTRKYKKHKKSNADTTNNAEDLDDQSESEPDDEELQTRFTADGLVQVDKKTGMVVKKLGGDNVNGNDTNDQHLNAVVFEVGTRVSASYRAKEQFDGKESWYDGVITKVNHNKHANNNHNTTSSIITYDIDYDDGDFEQEVEPRHVRELGPTEEEIEKEKTALQEEEARKRKRQKAREKARYDMVL
jgi:nucleolar protein 14